MSINSTIMALLKYLRKEGPVRECSALSKKETEQLNERMRQVLMTAGKKRSAVQGSYADHTSEYREVRHPRMVLLGTSQCLRRRREVFRANLPSLKNC